jgi:hypothetical protein
VFVQCLMVRPPPPGLERQRRRQDLGVLLAVQQHHGVEVHAGHVHQPEQRLEHRDDGIGRQRLERALPGALENARVGGILVDADAGAEGVEDELVDHGGCPFEERIRSGRAPSSRQRRPASRLLVLDYDVPTAFYERDATWSGRG